MFKKIAVICTLLLFTYASASQAQVFGVVVKELAKEALKSAAVEGAKTAVEYFRNLFNKNKDIARTKGNPQLKNGEVKGNERIWSMSPRGKLSKSDISEIAKTLRSLDENRNQTIHARINNKDQIIKATQSGIIAQSVDIQGRDNTMVGIAGDYVAGNKIEGDYVAGDKVELSKINPVDRLLQNSDLLTPANEPTPELQIPPGRPSHVPDEAVTVADSEIMIFIGNFAISTAESSFVVIKLYGKDLLKISRIGTGISVSADIWDDDGKILATIENNKFRVNPNKTIPIIRPDPHTLIVEDERKVPVLSIRFLNSKTVKIGGTFRAGGKYPVIIDEKEVTFGPLLITCGIALHAKGKAIFDWPGKVPDSKTYLGPNDNIPIDQAVLRVAKENGACNVIIRNSRGEEYSLFQIGGSNVLDGTHLWAAICFQLRSSDSY